MGKFSRKCCRRTVNMKSLIIFAVVALAWSSEAGPSCDCGMFVTVSMAEYEVYHLPRFDLESCDDEMDCKMGCVDEWEYIFDNGGLHYVEENKTMSIGDKCCIELAVDFDTDYFKPHEVYAYYKVCDGTWKYDGYTGLDYLCCYHGYYPGDCKPEVTTTASYN